MRVGSMCSGGGGLELAVGMLWPDAELAWVAEDDRHAAALLEARFPDVPNLGDLTAVDWHAVEPVDVVTAGFPCQDLSYAGRGAGITGGSRSGLWYAIADALGVLRPRLILLENVAAIVGRRPGLDVVLASLAELGLDAQWRCLRASDVGAPHRRDRWFCVAYPGGEAGGARDAERGDGGAQDGRRGAAEPRGRHRAAADASGAGAGRDARALPRPAAGARRQAADVRTAGYGGADAADPDGRGLEVGQELDREPSQAAADGRPRRGHADGRGLEASPDTERIGRLDRRLGEPHAGGEAGHAQGRRPAGRRWRARYGGREVDYTPAIERWGAVLGRPAPAPTDARGRLSPPFVEWMQGWPQGWTDGLSRTQALKVLGNGVVPLQAYTAYRLLLERLKEAQVAA